MQMIILKQGGTLLYIKFWLSSGKNAVTFSQASGT